MQKNSLATVVALGFVSFLFACPPDQSPAAGPSGEDVSAHDFCLNGCFAGGQTFTFKGSTISCDCDADKLLDYQNCDSTYAEPADREGCKTAMVSQCTGYVSSTNDPDFCHFTPGQTLPGSSSGVVVTPSSGGGNASSRGSSASSAGGGNSSSRDRCDTTGGRIVPPDCGNANSSSSTGGVSSSQGVTSSSSATATSAATSGTASSAQASSNANSTGGQSSSVDPCTGTIRPPSCGMSSSSSSSGAQASSAATQSSSTVATQSSSQAAASSSAAAQSSSSNTTGGPSWPNFPVARASAAPGCIEVNKRMMEWTYPLSLCSATSELRWFDNYHDSNVFSNGVRVDDQVVTVDAQFNTWLKLCLPPVSVERHIQGGIKCASAWGDTDNPCHTAFGGAYCEDSLGTAGLKVIGFIQGATVQGGSSSSSSGPPPASSSSMSASSSAMGTSSSGPPPSSSGTIIGLSSSSASGSMTQSSSAAPQSGSQAGTSSSSGGTTPAVCYTDMPLCVDPDQVNHPGAVIFNPAYNAGVTSDVRFTCNIPGLPGSDCLYQSGRDVSATNLYGPTRLRFTPTNVGVHVVRVVNPAGNYGDIEGICNTLNFTPESACYKPRGSPKSFLRFDTKLVSGKFVTTLLGGVEPGAGQGTILVNALGYAWGGLPSTCGPSNTNRACRPAYFLDANGLSLTADQWNGMYNTAGEFRGYKIVYKNGCQNDLYCQTTPAVPANAGQVMLPVSAGVPFTLVAVIRVITVPLLPVDQEFSANQSHWGSPAYNSRILVNQIGTDNHFHFVTNANGGDDMQMD